MHLYVYYDVPDASASAVRERLSALQAELGVVHPRLRRRADRGTTWMEVYEDVAPDFEERLAAAVARHGLAALTGPRHVERFVDAD